jgi:biopolymer transport protein ExbD
MSMSTGKKGVTSDINITPYIDILLVLLIIFMVTVPMKRFKHDIRIPQPATKVQQQNVKNDSIIVDMDLDRSLKLNNQPITLDKLETTLTPVFAPRAAKKNIFIRAEASIPYGEVFEIIDLVRHAGATDVALIQKHDAKNATADASQNAR